MHLLLSLLVIGGTAPAYAQDEGEEASQWARLSHEGPTGTVADRGTPYLVSPELRAEGELRSWAYLQTWATLYDEDLVHQADPASYGDPEHDPGFSIARARLGLDGMLPLSPTQAQHFQVNYALSVGVGAPYDALSPDDSDVQLVDAYTRIATPFNGHLFSTAVGAQRVPFTRESLISSSMLLFQERAPGAAWLAPGRDIGILAAQQLRTGPEDASLLVRLGAFNGNGDLFGDMDSGMLFSGRLEWLSGKAYQTWDPEGAPAIGIGVAGRSNQTAATRNTGIGADLLARVAHITLLAEMQQDTTEPTLTDVKRPAVPAPTDRLAYMAQLSRWFGLQGASGLEIGARFASFDDADGFEDNGDVWLAHGGVTWRNLLPSMDLGAGYIHRGEWVGKDRANDSVRVWMQLRPVSH